MKKLLILLFVLFAILVSLLFFQAGSSKKLVNPIPLSTPAPEISEVGSIEGSMKLVMTKKQNTSGTIFYSFIILDKFGKTTPIFEKTAGAGESMSLPRNSWSPNNKHVFIEDRIGTLTDYLVFKVSGEAFPDGQQYLNVTALFNQKVKNYNLKAVTGWDDPVLMSVLTSGPRFWFEVTSQNFIQLAR